MTFTKNIVTDYSCPIDGTSDCRAAFLAWKADAQGLDSILTVPAHTYNFKAGGSSQFPFDGIPSLIVEATGAIFTDDAGAGGISYGTATGIQVGVPQSSARIQTAFAGQSAVTLTTLADYSIFTVGRWVAVSAYDLQGGGSDPPNPYYFEFAQVSGIDSGTGIITFVAPLAYSYLSTFPLYDAGSVGQPDEGGPATIYALPAKWDTALEFRGLTINVTSAQLFAKGKTVKFLNCTLTGGGSMVPTVNKTWTLSGASSNFGFTSEFDKLIDTVVIENGATFNQPFIQSSAPNTLIIDGATVTTLNGTPKNTIVRNGATIGSLKIGPLGYGRTDSFQASDSTVSAVTWTPPQYNVSDYPTISSGLITRAIASGPASWAMPSTHFIIAGSYENEACPAVLSVTQVLTSAKFQTTLTGGWPSLPGTLKIGPHPCPRVRITNCSGCADIADLSQAGAYDRPLYSYTKRTYTGLTGSAVGHQIWGRPTSIIVNVTSAAAGTLHLGGQFDNFPVIKTDSTVTTYAPTVDLSVFGIHIIIPPDTYWFPTQIVPYCVSTTAVFSIEIITDQGFDTVDMPSTKHIRKPKMISHFQSTDWVFVR